MNMSKVAGSLDRLRIDGCHYVLDPTFGTGVFHVNGPHALTQAAGYLKYTYGLHKSSVFFRGQTRLHRTLSPTLVRGITTQNAQSLRTTAITKACCEIAEKNKIFNQVPPKAHEALLQHYGFKTTWIDLVDNVWIALWFSCHKAHTTGKSNQYLHFEQRDPYREEEPLAYILLIQVDNGFSNHSAPGLYQGKTTELIDLRIAAPSIFLRPHSQHGVLFRMRGNQIRRPIDYASQICGVIRMDLRDALAWLGAGKLTGTHVLFPPPFYDRGYALLLESGFIGTEYVGSICHIGT